MNEVGLGQKEEILLGDCKVTYTVNLIYGKQMHYFLMTKYIDLEG
jgi:hypothetical protein